MPVGVKADRATAELRARIFRRSSATGKTALWPRLRLEQQGYDLNKGRFTCAMNQE
jgi:hypothetical protein